MRDARASLDELPGPLQANAAKKVERRHSAVLHEQPQQVALVTWATDAIAGIVQSRSGAARSIPAVMPAVDATRSSTTNTRLVCGAGGFQMRPQHPAQPVRDGDDLRRRPAHVNRRSANEHDPRRRVEACRPRLERRDRQPDRRRDRRHRAGESQAELRSLAVLGMVGVHQPEGFGRPCNVEQQRMRRR